MSKCGNVLDDLELIEKSIYNIDSKICGIIKDFEVLKDPQKVADYAIQFLRTYIEHIAARIFAFEYPEEPVPIRGKTKWYTNYIKSLKQKNEYGYLWRLHESLQITVSHYVPEEDGAIRLMEGYLPKLYQLRSQMREMFGLKLLGNLEDYPQDKSSELDFFYEKIYEAIYNIDGRKHLEHTNYRYYVLRKSFRQINGRAFFEYILSYAQENISKFDRFVAYSLCDIPTNYAVQCDFASTSVEFNGIDVDITCVANWYTSIRPCELEKIAALYGKSIDVRSENTYYSSLMKFITKTGLTLLDIILSEDEDYKIYIQKTELINKTELKEAFDAFRNVILSENSGHNVLRYLIAFLRNDVIRDQLSDRPNNRASYLYIKNEALPFDEMPYASELSGHIIPRARLNRCLDIQEVKHQLIAARVNQEAYDGNMLYVPFDDAKFETYKAEAEIFNDRLYSSAKQQLRKIKSFANHLYVENYYESTKSVIKILQSYTSSSVEGYEDLIVANKGLFEEMDDDAKKEIVENIFKNSKLGMIYGAAGTGKTRIAEYMTKLFEGQEILILANTNAAINNLKRRISVEYDCHTIYDFLKNGPCWKEYNLVIVDECSTVSNDEFMQLLEKCNANALLLIGDIYQIESIKFGNWFNFARFFVEKKSVYELQTPYRAKDKQLLLEMWKCVREFDPHMFERLQANGFISIFDESVFERNEDEVILCLGYDGVYGINNINRYMQKINPSDPVQWGNWTYKVGDAILFNETKRFGNVLYNNLKGQILRIEKTSNAITFRIKVERVITGIEANDSGVRLIDCDKENNKSTVEFSVRKRVERDSDDDHVNEIVPFQIAYAISIHKAQGLEYNSVKVIITEDIDERISHNIFYTAITRTTNKLKIYMSKDTQNKLASRFVDSNVGLKQAQLFAGHAKLKLKNRLAD